MTSEPPTPFLPMNDAGKKFCILARVVVAAKLAVLLLGSATMWLNAHSANVDMNAGMIGITTLASVVFYFVVAIIAAVYFCKWEYSTFINSRFYLESKSEIDQTMKSDSVSVIASWFVPILNLFRPIGYMSTLYRATAPDAKQVADWRKLSVPTYLGLWWFCWIGSLLFDQISGRAPDIAGSFLVLGLVSWVFYVAAAVLVCKAVRQITERQLHQIHTAARAVAER
jgi:uncharacterized membrane protein